MQAVDAGQPSIRRPTHIQSCSSICGAGGAHFSHVHQAAVWCPLQETPENLLRVMTLKGLHPPDLNLMELHETHLKHADPQSVGHEDQDPGLSLEHCTTAMTDVITPSGGRYSPVIPAEDKITERDRRAELSIMCEPGVLVHSVGITSLYNQRCNPTADGSFMENRSGTRTTYLSVYVPTAALDSSSPMWPWVYY